MKLRIVGLCALAASVGVTSVTCVARAQTDAVSAEALFDAGRKLMAAGRYAEACPKLAESQRLDPGVGTLLNLGDCYDKNGQIALAWATFRQADAIASREGQTERAKYARRRTGELEKRLATLTIEVPPTSRVPGLQVLRDGEEIREPMWATAFPVDPGEHKIEARAPGYKPFLTTITASREAPPVSIPLLEKPPDETPPPPPPIEPPPPPPKEIVVVVPPPPPEPPPPSTAQRTAGIVVTAFGLAGVTVGAVVGAFAMSRSSAATDAGCDKTTCPTTDGLDKTNDALTFARVSTWAFVAGAVVTVGGLVLWLTAPKASKSTAWIAPAPFGATLGGTF